jgi:hypothetical protein
MSSVRVRYLVTCVKTTKHHLLLAEAGPTGDPVKSTSKCEDSPANMLEVYATDKVEVINRTNNIFPAY